MNFTAMSAAGPNLDVRAENAADAGIIAAVTAAAFQNHPVSQGTESAVIDGLRSANALAVSLVAMHIRQVVGHIAFSPAAPANGATGWYALGPVSVLPGLQRQGIVVPALTPRPIVMKLNAEINKALQSPILRERYATIEAEPVGGTPEQFAAFVKKEAVKWGEVVKKSGAKVD